MQSPPPSTGQRLARLCDIVLASIAGSLLFAMMVLTFVDVILRYFFNAPIRGGFEVTEIMMAVLIFAGLPLVSRRYEHVTIDAFDGFLPDAWRRGVHAIVQLVSAAALTGMAWLLARKAASFVEVGDVTQTLRIPIGPFVYLMAALTLATAVVHLLYAFLPPPAAVPDDAAGIADGGSAV